MDYSKLSLGELLSYDDKIIRRNAISILKQFQKTQGAIREEIGNDDKTKLSNNCKNIDEGHEWCWSVKCECKCHNYGNRINSKTEPISNKDVIRNDDGDEIEN